MLSGFMNKYHAMDTWIERELPEIPKAKRSDLAYKIAERLEEYERHVASREVAMKHVLQNHPKQTKKQKDAIRLAEKHLAWLNEGRIDEQ